MRAIRPESSLRTMLVARRPRLRLVDFFVKMWLLNAWPALNLPDAVLRNRLAAARLVLILGMTQLLSCVLVLGRAPHVDVTAGTFHPCSIRLVGKECRSRWAPYH